MTWTYPSTCLKITIPFIKSTYCLVTLFYAFGIYVGYDVAASLWSICYCDGSLQAQAGRIILGFDWFYKTNGRNRTPNQ
jgi:hypothetical protein